jgi:hypothetical protein
VIQDHRVVVVIPAGRRRYLELLFGHLEQQRAMIDRVDLWLNTRDVDDRAWMKQVWQDNRDWVRLVACPVAVAGNKSIRAFYPQACEPGTFYVRLDDDIVWMDREAIAELLDARLVHQDALLVCGNIVNNAICSHLHQRAGAMSTEAGVVGYECMDATGWRSPTFAEAVHRAFLADMERRLWERWLFSDWYLVNRERFSINAICWRGEDLAPLADQVAGDEEDWWTTMATEQLGKFNVIAGSAVFAHFGFITQRAHLDKTDLLEQYRRLLP